MKLSVIIPMYNENSIVTDTAAELGAYLDDYCKTGGHTFELIFSDDGSCSWCQNVQHQRRRQHHSHRAVGVYSR